MFVVKTCLFQLSSLVITLSFAAVSSQSERHTCLVCNFSMSIASFASLAPTSQSRLRIQVFVTYLHSVNKCHSAIDPDGSPFPRTSWLTSDCLCLSIFAFLVVNVCCRELFVARFLRSISVPPPKIICLSSIFDFLMDEPARSMPNCTRLQTLCSTCACRHLMVQWRTGMVNMSFPANLGATLLSAAPIA